MARKIKRSTLFALVAIVGLLSLGLGYAAWDDSITINGNVQTASFDMIWHGTSSASGNCTIAYGSGGTDPDELVVTVTNAYPGSNCTVNAIAYNNGGAPATMDSVLSFSGVDILSGAVVVNPTSCDLDGGDNVVGPAESETCTFTVTVSEMNSNPNSNYTFTATASFSAP